MDNVTLFSLNELARELSLNKSKLSYYASLDLITPASTVGRMMIFNKVETIDLIKKIEKLRKSGRTLQEIKELIK
jgi:DNA-binding transcriptional MerR regulator